MVVAVVVLLLVAASIASGLSTSSSSGSVAPDTSAPPAASEVPSSPDATDGAASPLDVPTEAPATAPPSASNGRLPGEPNPALTPGAVNPSVTPATLGATICHRGWTATVRPPSSYTTGLKRTQIVEYGYADHRLSSYEEDHLIPLELGGAPRDPRNLWPEPYSATLPDGTPVGARVKDQLENRLNDLVCGGDMPLATAQHLIATDWVAAWQRYGAP